MSVLSSPLQPEQNVYNFNVVCSSNMFTPRGGLESPINCYCVVMLIYALVFICIYNNCDVQAKQQYELEERKKELKRQRGEDTWMLPEINQRLHEIQDVIYIVFFYIKCVCHYMR